MAPSDTNGNTESESKSTQDENDETDRKKPPEDTAEKRRTISEENSLDPIRQTIAERLQTSYQNAVHVTVSRAIDAEKLLTATETLTERLDVSVSVPDLVLLALSETLDEHPAFNATYEDGTHRLYEEHNIGVAVDIDAGLVAPVLTSVETMSLRKIATERRDLTKRVQSGDFTMSDLKGGTITVTNLGPFDIDSFTPIINPPQVAIIGLNRIREQPCPGKDSVEIRHQINVDLSFDHRVVDGADASRFLGTLTENIENINALTPDE